MAYKGKLRSRFTDEQILAAYADANHNIAAAARTLNVPRTTLSDWIFQMDHGRKHALHLQKADRIIREPSPYDDETLDDYKIDTSCILVIPDLHCPYHHPKALQFLRKVRDQYQPTLVICLGDELDYHALSFHDSDPNLNASGRELSEGRKYMNQLHDLFPQLQICHSNHGSLVYRRAKAHGIPVEMIRTYREIIFPNGRGRQWSWHHRIHHILPDGSPIIFRHQAAGQILNCAAHEHASLVIGHHHGRFAIQYAAGEKSRFFAVNSGCLIDKNSLAFAYGQENRYQAVLGCCVIKDSVPVLIPMNED